jgi:hypothetical protein
MSPTIFVAAATENQYHHILSKDPFLNTRRTYWLHSEPNKLRGHNNIWIIWTPGWWQGVPIARVNEMLAIIKSIKEIGRVIEVHLNE